MTYTFADASKVSGSEFFHEVFGPAKYTREETAERSEAWRECQAGLRLRNAEYWAQRAHDDACYARYAARLREIAEKYALTETIGDPLLKKRSAGG